MKKSIKDVTAYWRQSVADHKEAEVIQAISGEIRSAFRNACSEAELIAVDYVNTFYPLPGVCRSHDYMDANMPAFEALKCFSMSAVGITDQAFEDQALAGEDVNPDKDVLFDILNRAWDAARLRGFSRLWEMSDDSQFRKDVTTLIGIPPRRMEKGHPLRNITEDDAAEAFDRLAYGAGAVAEKLEVISNAVGNTDEYVIDFIQACLDAKPLEPRL